MTLFEEAARAGAVEIAERDMNRLQPYYRSMRIRAVAFLLAHDGCVSLTAFRAFLRQCGVDHGSRRRGDGSSDGAIAGRVLVSVMRPLVEDGVVVRTPDGYVCDELPWLVDWLADEVDDGYEPLVWWQREEAADASAS